MIRYGMTIDLDRCTGCGACMVACAVGEQRAAGDPGATDRTGITWIRVFQIDNGVRAEADRFRSRAVPAVRRAIRRASASARSRPSRSIPPPASCDQMPERCLGCRYCMAACPYHARYFNWWDPSWPPGMEKTLNPDVAPRMRGVVEKCNFCHGRWHAAQPPPSAGIDPADYQPACVEACPTQRHHVRRSGRYVERGGATARSEDVPPAANARHRTEDLLPLHARLGAATRVTHTRGTEVARMASAFREARSLHRARTPTAAPRDSSLLWILPWFALLGFGLYAAGLCLVEGLEPDQHGQPLRLRPVDLPRPDRDRARRRRVLHRLPALHPQDARTQGRSSTAPW